MDKQTPRETGLRDTFDNLPPPRFGCRYHALLLTVVATYLPSPNTSTVHNHNTERWLEAEGSHYGGA